MLLHTQQAPLKEGFHIIYNTDDMTHQKLSLTKLFIILCNSPTAQLYVLDIGQVRLGALVRNCFSVRTILNSTGSYKLPR